MASDPVCGWASAWASCSPRIGHVDLVAVRLVGRKGRRRGAVLKEGPQMRPSSSAASTAMFQDARSTPQQLVDRREVVGKHDGLTDERVDLGAIGKDDRVRWFNPSCDGLLHRRPIDRRFAGHEH